VSDEVRYVRLKPEDHKSGFLVRDFTQRFEGRFYRFREAGVWHRVPKALADQLARARQIPQRPNSPPVFDICTEAEARQRDAAAKREREAMRAVVEPSVDTAREVPVSGAGRGDLSLEEVTAGRRAALEEASARALGGDASEDDEPAVEPAVEPDEKPKPKSRRSKGRSRKRKS